MLLPGDVIAPLKRSFPRSQSEPEKRPSLKCNSDEFVLFQHGKTFSQKPSGSDNGDDVLVDEIDGDDGSHAPIRFASSDLRLDSEFSMRVPVTLASSPSPLGLGCDDSVHSPLRLASSDLRVFSDKLIHRPPVRFVSSPSDLCCGSDTSIQASLTKSSSELRFDSEASIQAPVRFTSSPTGLSLGSDISVHSRRFKLSSSDLRLGSDASIHPPVNLASSLSHLSLSSDTPVHSPKRISTASADLRVHSDPSAHAPVRVASSASRLGLASDSSDDEEETDRNEGLESDTLQGEDLRWGDDVPPDRFEAHYVDASTADESVNLPENSNVIHESLVDGKINRCPHTKPVHIFLGTWNTEYKEFPVKAMLSSSLPLMPFRKPPAISLNPEYPQNIVGSTESESSKIRKELLRSELTTEKVSITVSTDNNNLDYTRHNSRKIKYQRSEASSGERNHLPPQNRSSSDIECSESDRKSDSTTSGVPEVSWSGSSRSSRKRAEKLYESLPDHYEPFQDWIPHGYDVYVIALQEVISNRLLRAILVYLNRINGKPFHKIKFQEDRISGLGDGAYLSRKSTVIGCFVSRDVLGVEGPVCVGSSKGFALNTLNGSKGAVAIVLTIHNQITCFISCHLPGGKPDARCKARDFIRRKLADTYSEWSGAEPTDVFHHIVWMGDFNLKVHEIKSSTVLEKLYAGDNESILAFDEFQYPHFNADFKKDGFAEAPITFLPTYKKWSGRIPIDVTDPLWLHKEYNIRFKVRWYKGGRTEDRVPSWTDRIFKWSNRALDRCFVFIPGTYKAATPPVNTILLQSDHSPLCCGMSLFALPSIYKCPPVFFVDSLGKIGRLASNKF